MNKTSSIQLKNKIIIKKDTIYCYSLKIPRETSSAAQPDPIYVHH